MQSEDMIVLDEFCVSHELDVSFIRSLEEHGLVEIVSVNQVSYINMDELPQLEKIVRIHDELNVNPEGIDAIKNLLQRIEDLQNEIATLKNRLSFYGEK